MENFCNILKLSLCVPNIPIIGQHSFELSRWVELWVSLPFKGSSVLCSSRLSRNVSFLSAIIILSDKWRHLFSSFKAISGFDHMAEAVFRVNVVVVSFKI